jgi:hypothetical protein
MVTAVTVLEAPNVFVALSLPLADCCMQKQIIKKQTFSQNHLFEPPAREMEHNGETVDWDALEALALQRLRLAVQHMNEKHAELDHAVQEAIRIRKQGREELCQLAQAATEARHAAAQATTNAQNAATPAEQAPSQD